METTKAKKNTVKPKKAPAAPTDAIVASVYDQKGKTSGTMELPKDIFGLPWNGDLVHQVITSMTSNARANTAHTKFRGEVSGTGKKPWKQKGTGKARHGSTRSPIWVGGGVAHGPRNDRNYDKKINKKMKTKALFTLLSKKFKNNQILFVDTLALAEIKTKKAAEVSSALGSIAGFEKMKGATKRTTYVALPAKNQVVEKSFANLPNLFVGDVQNLSPLDVVMFRYLIITDPNACVQSLQSRIK